MEDFDKKSGLVWGEKGGSYQIKGWAKQEGLVTDRVIGISGWSLWFISSFSGGEDERFVIDP